MLLKTTLEITMTGFYLSELLLFVRTAGAKFKPCCSFQTIPTSCVIFHLTLAGMKLFYFCFRSSVDRGSGDTPRQAIDHEALVKSFGVKGGGGGGSLETSIESGRTGN